MLLPMTVVGVAAFVAGLTVKAVPAPRLSTLATAVGLGWLAAAMVVVTVGGESLADAIMTGFLVAFTVIACAPLGARLRERLIRSTS
jgi:peptidoglycan/LPS O-acetylase OafA/YrhL